PARPASRSASCPTSATAPVKRRAPWTRTDAASCRACASRSAWREPPTTKAPRERHTRLRHVSTMATPPEPFALPPLGHGSLEATFGWLLFFPGREFSGPGGLSALAATAYAEIPRRTDDDREGAYPWPGEVEGARKQAITHVNGTLVGPG